MVVSDDIVFECLEQYRGQAVGYSAKSTLPVPREKCGCALCAATCSNLQIGLRFVLSFQVTIVENI
jgi:hypothetical protein